jgi:hypothetical protein
MKNIFALILVLVVLEVQSNNIKLPVLKTFKTEIDSNEGIINTEELKIIEKTSKIEEDDSSNRHEESCIRQALWDYHFAINQEVDQETAHFYAFQL